MTSQGFLNNVIALLAPGQGSQTPGMLTAWLDCPEVTQQLDEWSHCSGLDLIRLGTQAPAEEITNTAIAQPLIVATTLVAYMQLRATGYLDGHRLIIAGHSVGEIAAYAIAGVISYDDAIQLATIRGREMAQACTHHPTGMAAVLGGDETEVLTCLHSLGLIPANRNAAGQIVAAGPRQALEALAANPPHRARVRHLATAGAFHTHFMDSARPGYAHAIHHVHPQEPTSLLLSNRDGQPPASAQQAMEYLLDQITRPVRWDLCNRTLAEHHVQALIELPPAGTLIGIAKRELRKIPAYGLNSPSDLDQLSVLSTTTVPASMIH